MFRLPRLAPSHPAVTLRACLAAVAIGTAASPAGADDLLAAWRMARAHDATFAAAVSTLAAAREKLVQGDALLRPHADLNTTAGQATVDYHAGRTAPGLPSGTARGQTYGASVTLAQPIYDAAGAVARDRLHREAEQAEAVFEQAAQYLALRVARAYVDVDVAREVLRLAEAQQQAITRQLGLARSAYERGDEPINDLNDAQARYDAVEATRIADGTDLEAKSIVFRQLTALDPGPLARCATARQASPSATSLDQWLSQAQEHNPGIRAIRLDLTIAHAAIDQYKLRNVPVLSMVASYGRVYENGSISASGGRDATATGSIGIQLTMPLFDGGARSSLWRQAVATESAQQDTLQAAQRDAETATRQYFASLRDGAVRIRALERARDSGAAAVASGEAGRRSDARSMNDLLDTQEKYFETLATLAAARCDFVFTEFELAATSGTLDESAISRLNDHLDQAGDGGLQAPRSFDSSPGITPS